MCDDHSVSALLAHNSPMPGATPGKDLSRRSFVYGSAAVAAAGALRKLPPRLPLRSAARAVTADGTRAYSMAMHVHSSFSEQVASMDSQLAQAARNSMDVLWWTDHDARMDALDFRDVVHFTSLSAEPGGPGQGAAWDWRHREACPLARGSGGIVSQPATPNDPARHGSLAVTAKSANGQAATYGYFADSLHAGWNYRDNLTGQSLSIDVLLKDGWRNGYLELAVASSYHTASAGRPAGLYSLSYRFVPAGTPGGRQAQGLLGVVTVPVTPGAGGWYTATLTPSSDIAALWPDLDYRDFALWGLSLSAVSTGDDVGGYFGYLRFSRATSGEAFLQQQAAMASALAPKYPGVTQELGLEVSWRLPHMNWFGGQVSVPSYDGVAPEGYADYLANTLIPGVHSNGGLVSYNHPFGYSFVEPRQPTAHQDALLRQVAAALLPRGSSPAALGADLIEVGYPLREGVDLAHHVGLWDVLSRNGVFLTGNGTTDDHFGQDWTGLENNWFTSAWAASTAQADLLSALAAGRAWCASLGRYGGSMDLLADGSAPMGSVTVSQARSRQVSVTATSVPAGGHVQVIQGQVDYAGRSDPSPNTTVAGSYSAAAFASGTVTLGVDTTESSFVRAQVLDAAGAVVGLSNPVWLLLAQPPGGIPPQRAA